MNSRSTLTLASDLQCRLAEILDDYLRAVEDGTAYDIDEVIAQNPDLAEPLREYLTSLQWLQDGVVDYRSPACEAERLVPAATPRELGDYRLIREVGRGGMGVVYEANQLSLDRKVALKVLPFAAVLDHKQILRFQNEARAAAQLHHPNIVPVYGVGSDRGVHFYAMQFIDGQSVREALEQLTVAVDSGDSDSKVSGSASDSDQYRTFGASHQTHDHVRAVARLGIQAAEALSSAHDCGVIHRDIKPSNLLLDLSGKLWVTDFGLARYQLDANVTASGDVVGTLHYMSPEQAQGKAVLIDQRTDVYSLGVTLYELLTLRRPFNGSSQTDVLRQIELGDYKKVRHWNPSISRDLENVVAKAMAHRREERYSTAQELADDLHRFMVGKSTLAKPPTMPQRVTKWARRHQRSVMAAVAVCCLGLVGLLAGNLVLARQMARTEFALQAALRNQELADDRLELAESNLEEARSAVERLGLRATEFLDRVPGTETQRLELLQMVIEHHDRLMAHDSASTTLRMDAALTQAKTARLVQQLGEVEQAADRYRLAQSLLSELVDEQPDQAQHRVQLALCLNNHALLQASLGQHDQAESMIGKAIQLQRQLRSRQPGLPGIDVALARSWINLAVVGGEKGDREAAVKALRTAIDLLRSEPTGLDEFHVQRRQALARAYDNLSLLTSADRPVQAAAARRKSIEIQRRLLAADPTNLQSMSDLANDLTNLAALWASRAEGDYSDQILRALREASRLQRDLIRREPFVVDHQINLAITLNNHGMALSRRDQLADALSVFGEALTLQKTVVQDLKNADLTNAANLTSIQQLGGIYNNIAMAHQMQEDLQRAADNYDLAIRFQQYAHRKAPHVASFRDHLNRTLVNYGRVLRQLKRAGDALNVTRLRRGLWSDHPQQLFGVAEEIARTYQMSDDDRDRQTFTDEAMMTVQMAIRAGWKPDAEFRQTSVFQAFKSDDRLASLLAPMIAVSDRPI